MSFCLTITRPPRPTLFPYTTLFRSLGLGRDKTCNNRDTVRLLVAGSQSLLFFFSRFCQRTSASTACGPDLREKIVVAIAVEDQLGLRLRCVHRRGERHHNRGFVSVRASDQQCGSVIVHSLHFVLTGRERHLPRCELKWNTREYGLLRSGVLDCCQQGQP